MAQVHINHFVHTNPITVPFVLSVLTLSHPSSASFSQIRQTIQNLHFEKKSGGFGLRETLDDTDFDMELDTPVRLKTSFSSFFYDQLKKIDNYGCWCSFTGDTGFGGEPGYGKVMDEIDQICKDLRQGYRCAVIDDVTNKCVPWAANYSSSNSLLTDEGQILDACKLDNVQHTPNSNKTKHNMPDNENNTDCAVRACTLENTFILDFIKYLVSGKQVNQVFMNSAGFDKKANCKVEKQVEDENMLWARSTSLLDESWFSGSGEGGDGFDEEHLSGRIIPDKMCCGEYPKRFPFMTKGGQRACCDKRTYDTSKFECCDARVAVNCL